MTDHARTVAGESLDDLVKVMSNVRLDEHPQGLNLAELVLNEEETAIFRRALMRLEAELLLDDADVLDAGSLATMRSPAQRQHDAFMLLVDRIIEATTHPG